VEEIDPQAPARELINEAVTVPDGGGLAVDPTETRYGLLARADRKIPADRLARAKRRASEKPISIFVGTIEMITHYAELRPTALRLARIFLPGPLTLVLPAVGSWHPVIAPVGKIGVRVSASPVSRRSWNGSSIRSRRPRPTSPATKRTRRSSRLWKSLAMKSIYTWTAVR